MEEVVFVCLSLKKNHELLSALFSDFYLRTVSEHPQTII